MIFFIWEHGEEKLRNFVEILNEIHPTIKFTAEWSQKSINFLHVTVSLIDGQIETDLTDSGLQIVTNTFILPCVTLCKKKNNFFDIHCNNLEKWLSDRGYSETLVRKEILKARSQSRETHLDKEKMSRNDDKVNYVLSCL